MTAAQTWEPKVAKLEAEIESVTRDVASLTTAVHDLTSSVKTLAENTSAQFERLLVGVTTAAAPKGTNWQVVVAACLLILTLGAAVLSPLEQRLTSIREEAAHIRNRVDEHLALPMHQVGSARVDALERLLQAKTDDINKELDKVRSEGTPITASRLSVLESRVGQLERAAH